MENFENLSEPPQRSRVYKDVKKSLTICDSEPRSDIFDVNKFIEGNFTTLSKEYSNSRCNMQCGIEDEELLKRDSINPEHNYEPPDEELMNTSKKIVLKSSIDSLTCSRNDADMLRTITQDILTHSAQVIQKLEDEFNEFLVKTTEDIAKHIAKIETKQNQQFEQFVNGLLRFTDDDELQEQGSTSEFSKM